VLAAADFLAFRRQAEAAGLTLPLIATVLPWHSRANFEQVNAFCGVPLPLALRADIDRLAAGAAPDADDPPVFAALGLQFTVSLCRDLLAGIGGGGGAGGGGGTGGGARSVGGPRVLHFATMNCEGAVAAVLRELGLSGPEAASRRKLPWRPSAVSSRAHEEMRPIFWANRPAAYVERTAHCKLCLLGNRARSTTRRVSRRSPFIFSTTHHRTGTEFPAGRWKTARRGGGGGSEGSEAAVAPHFRIAAPPEVAGAEQQGVGAGPAGSDRAADATDAASAPSGPGEPFSPLSQSQLVPSEAGTPEQRRAIWGANPSEEKHIWQVFAGYLRGTVPRLPWCDKALEPETGTICGPLERLNAAGFLSINSQPRVNACRSDDPTFGWGGPGGLVYQKAYVECFCPRGHLAALMEAVELSLAEGGGGGPQRSGNVSYTAINAAGETFSSRRLDCAMAVTWGVFPDREVQQPTIVDYAAFRAWKSEAFALWLQQWGSIYEAGSEAGELLREVHDSYFLVSVVDNDFVRDCPPQARVRAAVRLTRARTRRRAHTH
jgi:hypothetical protein